MAGGEFSSRSEVLAPNGMVATSHPLATQIGLDMLRRGGSAVDAGIAANAALGLMEPTGCGPGGDLYAIVWEEKTRRLWGLNASGRSPQQLDINYFRDHGIDEIPAVGPLSVSVPGAVDGWFELHQRFGRLPMAELLQPSIDYARAGFPVTEIIAHTWQAFARILGDQPGFADTFMPGGSAPKTGELFRNPGLGDTYEKLARDGRDVFYCGEIADIIEQFMAATGGFITAADMAAHRSEWVDPICTDYRGLTIWELPPNTQGLAALQMLNILEGFDLTAMQFGSPDHVHAVVEAKKLAYEDRARFYADPKFADVPVEWLVSKGYANERRQLIDMQKAASAYPAGTPLPETGDTIYLSVGDRDGNMVSLIQSLFRPMGSGMTPPGTGLILQDRGELFSLDDDHPNVYAPGKRPFNTIIPGFVTKDGYRYMSFGVMGGPMQPQGHVQIMLNMLDFGMGLQEAGDAPRIRHSGSSQPTGSRMTDGGVVTLESGFAVATRDALQARGHRLEDAPGSFGGYQAVLWDQDRGIYAGASEARKDGQAAGY